MASRAISSRNACALTIVALLAVTSALPGAQDRQPSKIEWSACPPELGLSARMECSTYSVPIDWDEPTGERIDLTLYRLPCTDPSNRIGSIIHQPGGPGSPAWFVPSALEDPSWHFEANDTLQAHFDFVGIDSRGTGPTSLVSCDMGIYAESPSLLPKNEEEYEKLLDWSRRLGQSCLDKTGPLLGHMDTISVVKDYEAVRIALNEKMNFLGISYGTTVGALYAQMYPDNIRTMVLDAHVQASENNATALYGQDVKKIYTDLLQAARVTPQPAPLCTGTDCLTTVTHEDIIFYAQYHLIWAGMPPHPLGGEWGTLAEALYNATQGDFSAFSRRVDDPFALAFLAVACLDYQRQTSESYNLLRIKQIVGEDYAPLTLGLGEWWKVQHMCIGWPFESLPPWPKLNITTDATILIAATPRDPFGLITHALDMRYEIKNQALLVRDGEGHNNWLHGGEAANVITKYFITGEAPEDGLIVPASPDTVIRP